MTTCKWEHNIQLGSIAATTNPQT
uniref:Uncharacterized protein n=1 Tax=Arundo donax TaxID=35708 RepID=A0A0A9AV13_ARUDO